MATLTEADYRDYIAACNRGDPLHGHLNETLEVRQVIVGRGELVADVVTEPRQGPVRRSQDFIWYAYAGREFMPIRCAHYRSGEVPPAPAAAAPSGTEVAMSPDAFARYMDAFNRNDYAGFADYYTPDVTLVIAGRTELRGRQAIIDFYRGVKATTRRTILVNRLITTPGAIAAELQSEFLALEDLPDFTAGPMRKGGRIFINTIALYELHGGRFSRIRSALLRKIHLGAD